MGVRYKYEPKEFRRFLKVKDDSSITGETSDLGSTLGKSEWEEIAGNFLEKAIDKNEWPELEIKNVEDAEEMADVGYLFRCSPPVKEPEYNKLGWLRAGTYQITNEALENILNKKENNL